jgi:hypothetical protein
MPPESKLEQSGLGHRLGSGNIVRLMYLKLRNKHPCNQLLLTVDIFVQTIIILLKVKQSQAFNILIPDQTDHFMKIFNKLY